MYDLSTLLITSIAMIFVIEGLLYALFPRQFKKMLFLILTLKDNQLRNYGFIMILVGTLSVWLILK